MDQIQVGASPKYIVTCEVTAYRRLYRLRKVLNVIDYTTSFSHIDQLIGGLDCTIDRSAFTEDEWQQLSKTYN